jgi:DNA repair exonuclease SbcCD ATPase subunit
MIVFKTLEVKNFMSIGNVPMGYDFENGKTYLIHGKNGSGKSAILLDGLMFALYGKAFRAIGNGQIINSINGKDCMATVEFSIGQTEYKVQRGLKPNILKIWINGNLRERDAATMDYQKFLEGSVLRMDEKTFRQIVILGSKAYIPFMQLPTNSRRIVVEDLLSLGIFTIMGRVTKERLNGLMTEAKNNESDIRNTQRSIEETQSVIEQLKYSGGEYALQKQSEIDRNRAEIADAEAKIAAKQDEILKLTDGNDPSGEAKKLQALMNSIQENVSKVRVNLGRLTKENDFFAKNDVCSTCHQNISPEFKIEITQKNTIQIGEFNGMIELADRKKTETSAKIEQHNETLARIRELNEEIRDLQAEVRSHYKVIDVLLADIEKHSKKEGSNIGFYETKLVELNSRLTSVKQRDVEIVASARRLTYIFEMLREGGGIKVKIIETYLPLINKLIKHYMDIMEANIEFSFDEKFNEVIKSRHRDNFVYANFSEGEKLRIDLCMLFAWREISRLRNSAATNLVIFDEIGDSSLDGEGFDCFMKIIGEEKPKQCVVIISHSPEKIVNKCDRIYEYHKVRGFTALKSMQTSDTGPMSLT